MKIKYQHNTFGITNGVYAIIKGVKIQKENPELESQKIEVLHQILNLTDAELDNQIATGYSDILKEFNMPKLIPAGLNWVQLLRNRKQFFKINTAVDAYNIVAAKTFLSIGAHDLNKIAGDEIIFNLAKSGEVIPSVNQQKIYHVNEGDYVYRDAEKILAWLDVRDTDLAKITLETTDILLIIEGNRKTSLEYNMKSLTEACNLVVQYCGGSYDTFALIQ